MVLKGNKVTVTGTNDGKVSLSLSPTEGTFSGKFVYPGLTGTRAFEGVIYQLPSLEGAGFFLGPEQAGTVDLTQ